MIQDPARYMEEQNDGAIAEIKKWGPDRELSLLWNIPEFIELTRE